MTGPFAPTAVLSAADPAEVSVRAEIAADHAAVEALNDRAFGPGRFAKVSYAVREMARFRPDLSFCAFEGGELIGSVRQSVVSIAGQDILFLGPIAVAAEARKRGLGALLMERAIAAGTAAGFGLILLVGDLPLFARHGFVQVEPGRIGMPRPVDPRRVLWRVLKDGADTGVSGPIEPPRGV